MATIPRNRRPATMYTEHSLWNKMAIPLRALNRATIRRDGALIAVSQATQEALPTLRASAVPRRGPRGRSRHGAEDLLEDRGRYASRFGPSRGWRTPICSSSPWPTSGRKRDTTSYSTPHDCWPTTAWQQAVVSVGAGPLDTELRARHQELHLGDRFHFLGARGDVSRLLVGADIFVLASHHEGMPVVLMEATSVGPSHRGHRCGWHSPSHHRRAQRAAGPTAADPTALAEALERLVDDPELRQRLGRAAKETSEVFDVAAATAEVESVYRRLARGRG